MNNYLTADLDKVDPSQLTDALKELLSPGEPDVLASLAVAYDRKGYEERSNIDVKSPYRNAGHDDIILTVEVRIPEYSLGFYPSVEALVGDSQQGIEDERLARLEARKAAALAELEAVEKELES